MSFDVKKREESLEEYRYLFDTEIYRVCYSGAGYRKYHIVSIGGLNRIKETKGTGRLHLFIRANNWKDSALSEAFSVYYDVRESQKVEIILPRTIGRIWFLSPVDYFVHREQKNKVKFWKKKRQKQYYHELKEIKNKYPEEFL